MQSSFDKNNYIFLFDLDSTISSVEILPEISKSIGKEKDMRAITEATMKGIIPFKNSFISRVEMLADVSVEYIRKVVENIPLNKGVVEFIMENRDRCYVVTGNLDVWIIDLMKRIGMEDHFFCSKAVVRNDKIEKIISVLDKRKTVEQFVQPFVAIGDGDNDSEMAEISDVAIGFGGVRNIAPSLMENIDYAFIDDRKMKEFLQKFL